MFKKGDKVKYTLFGTNYSGVYDTTTKKEYLGKPTKMHIIILEDKKTLSVPFSSIGILTKIK